MLESLRIVGFCIVAAIVYGIIHDQVTAHICVEYFSVFHPPIFETKSPTLLALGWGVLATWWMGAFLGVLLAIAARVGARSALPAKSLLRPMAILLSIMSVCACLAGIAGYALAKETLIAPPEWVNSRLVTSSPASFMADWWAHSASYAVGLIGGIVLCVIQYRKRRVVSQA